MARVPYLERDDLPPEHRHLIDRNINLYRALAHSPNGMQSFRALGTFIRHKSRLDPRLRELAILQVGYLARAPYEWSHHVEIGRHFGVSDADIRAIMAENEGRASDLEPLARMVLRAAREMTRDLDLSDETYQALQRELDNERMLDLILTIAFYNGVVRLLAALRIDVEEGYLHYLDEFPLPSSNRE